MAAERPPSAELFLTTAQAYQRTAALRTAVELDLFTVIDSGAATVSEIAKHCGASERGVRQLADYLTVIGLLAKADSRYSLTPDSAVFLSKRSSSYLGGTLEFLASPHLTRNFDVLTETVRRGTVAPDSNTIADEHPVWANFARAMVPLMMPAAQAIGEVLGISTAGSVRILDVAAGHGIFGIVLAQKNHGAEVIAVDWPHVLAVAAENAKAMGVANRHRLLPGDAFKVDFGTGFDIVLITNFLHHFDRKTSVALLRKVAGAMNPGGRVVVLEFVPDEDRVSPPIPATFVLNMLAGTEAGDVYTVADLRSMLMETGFHDVSAHRLPSPETVVVGTKS